jgi:hypothetical protein
LTPNLFNTADAAVYAALKTALTTASLTPKYVGEDFTLNPDSPVILLDEQEALIKPLDMQTDLEVTFHVDLLVLVRESSAPSWFVNIKAVLGKVVDAILVDRTLGGAVKDVYPTSRVAGGIVYQNKSFFGGKVGLEGVFWFAP